MAILCFFHCFTLQDILKLQQCIFSMYRKMIGDHSYITRHTHVQILQQYYLEHPLGLLCHAGPQLRETLGQRLKHLTADDILWAVDWTHLPQLMQLVHAVWWEQIQVQMVTPAAEVPLTQHTCEYCFLQFTSLPNLRRHQTHVHGMVQLRTHMAVAVSFAVRGVPQCSHCFESFPSWRNFLIHLERNCCRPGAQCHRARQCSHKWAT